MRTFLSLTLVASTFALVSCSSSGSDNEIGESSPPMSSEPSDNSSEEPTAEQPAEQPAEPPVEEPNVQPETEARYRITFDANWTSNSHPVQFPSGNPHFSGLIGAVHNAQVIFWEPGQISTDGIELMAETGGKSLFINEINTAIEAGSTLSIIDGSGIGSGDGEASVEVTVSLDYPQVTLTTMLAPSPDWFAGLQNFELHDGSSFVGSMEIDAILWDAGTDTGVSYTSGNIDTQPRDPIAPTTSEPSDSSFVNGLPYVGRFIIERL